jgi:hypothetical protein
MYHAKEAGRNSHRFFTEQMNQQVVEHMSLETNLRRALENKEFVLHYQPQMDLAKADHRRRGAGALEQPGARPGGAGAFHPGGRGFRADRADRRLGAQRGLPAGARLAGRRIAALRRRRQSLGGAVQAAGSASTP